VLQTERCTFCAIPRGPATFRATTHSTPGFSGSEPETSLTNRGTLAPHKAPPPCSVEFQFLCRGVIEKRCRPQMEMRKPSRPATIFAGFDRFIIPATACALSWRKAEPVQPLPTNSPSTVTFHRSRYFGHHCAHSVLAGAKSTEWCADLQFWVKRSLRASASDQSVFFTTRARVRNRLFVTLVNLIALMLQVSNVRKKTPIVWIKRNQLVPIGSINAFNLSRKPVVIGMVSVMQVS